MIRDPCGVEHKWSGVPATTYAAIFAERDRKLAAAWQRRAQRRREAQKQIAEEPSRGVQRGDNEHPLVCVNAKKNGGAAAALNTLTNLRG